MADAPWQNRERLYELYWERGLSQTEIATELGCGQKTVSRWMERLEIAPERGRGQMAVDVPPDRERVL